MKTIPWGSGYIKTYLGEYHYDDKLDQGIFMLNGHILFTYDEISQYRSDYSTDGLDYKEDEKIYQFFLDNKTTNNFVIEVYTHFNDWFKQHARGGLLFDNNFNLYNEKGELEILGKEGCKIELLLPKDAIVDIFGPIDDNI